MARIPMKRSTAICLQAAVALIGAGALAFMRWEPLVEGRNAHASLFEIYFHDPFLAYAYAASVPFFAALHLAFKVLGHARRDQALTEEAAKSLRTVKYCAMALIGFAAVGELFIVFGDSDDRAGGVFMGALIACGAAAMAAAAAKLERILRES